MIDVLIITLNIILDGFLKNYYYENDDPYNGDDKIKIYMIIIFK